MAGTIYPLGIDGFAQLPIVIDGSSPVRAQDINLIRNAVVAIEKELGVNPSATDSNVRDRLDALDSLVDLLSATADSGDSTSIILDFLSLALEEPIDKSYNIITNIPYDGYMYSVSTKSSSGSATGTTLINGVPLGGGSNSISTTQDVVYHSTDRTFVSGDDIQFVVSANSSSADVVVTMVFLRFVKITGTNDVEAATTDPAPTAEESGKVFTNEGATSQVTMTLPSAAAGVEFTFVVQDNDGITITASSGDTIRVAGSVSIAGGTAASTTIGDTLSLLAINNTEWVAVSSHGTWTIT